MEFNFNKVLILGYGSSGHSVEDVLFYNHIEYIIYDQKIDLDSNKFISKISKKNIEGVDVAVLSPGISIYSNIVKKLRKFGIKIISEIEFAYYFCNSYIIAVTGTNGKTTTVNLINHILKSSGLNVELLGNVGTPFSDIYKSSADVVVLEVSSFQLEAIENFKPDIGILLNLAPDHIDRHKTFENYVNAKFEMFKNQTELDTAIISRDICKYSQIDKVKSKILCIYAKGINIENNEIVIYDEDERIKVCDVYDVSHINTCIDNVLASILACYVYGINLKDIVSALSTFSAPKHRCQMVKEINNVTYINDSKATNIHAMEYAVKSINNKPMYLMLGGFDKKLDFTDFISHIPHNIKELILFGDASKRISKQCKKCKYSNYIVFKKLIDAITYVKAKAEENSVVLFSPANSSFDEFDSYVERGEFFINNL